jgi:hypothetical protein
MLVWTDGGWNVERRCCMQRLKLTYKIKLTTRQKIKKFVRAGKGVESTKFVLNIFELNTGL